jgi:hypothetical protein
MKLEREKGPGLFPHRPYIAQLPLRVFPHFCHGNRELRFESQVFIATDFILKFRECR